MTTTPDVLRPGETCWRIARADRLALIVDAADYFVRLREALVRATHTIYLVGWDFDLRIEMVPGESDAEGRAPDGWPNVLGEFLEAVVAARPQVELRLLKWDGAMLAAIAQQAGPTLRLKASSKRIHFALDSHHPVGACHHQKIVVVDDTLAFCGGIDVTMGRWDTRGHVPDDPRRIDPNGEAQKPWHDVTTALEGPIAAALGGLARIRWEKATGEALTPPPPSPSPWPDALEAGLRGIDVAIARTEPPYHGTPLVNEIEELYLAAIRSAKRTIAIESQYLAAGTVCEALEARLAEPDGPEVTVVNPKVAQDFIENEAMHSVRARMIWRLREAAERGGGRFAIYHPANAAGEPIYVHAKVLAVDDTFLRIGSSNIDNRSMGFDTECDVAFVARTDDERRYVREFGCSLLAEHLDRTEEEVAEVWRETGSPIEVIERLNRPAGRGLRPIEPEPLDPLEVALADSRLFDPRYWPRNRPRPVETVKHAAKRGVAPYHFEAAGVGTVLAAVGVLALGAWAGTALARHLRGDEDERRAARLRSDFPAPGLVTDRTVRPPLDRSPDRRA